MAESTSTKHYIGVDLGQAGDYTAVSVVRPVMIEGVQQFHVVHLERFALGTPYDRQVIRVKEICEKVDNPVPVIDRTGVGRGVYDLFRLAGLPVIGITITAGDSATYESGGWRVPKRDLVAALTVPFQARRLKIAAELPEAETLRNELLTFKIKINPVTANTSYESWRERDHDDLVLSVAMAVWYATKQATTTTLIMGVRRNW